MRIDLRQISYSQEESLFQAGWSIAEPGTLRHQSAIWGGYGLLDRSVAAAASAILGDTRDQTVDKTVPLTSTEDNLRHYFGNPELALVLLDDDRSLIIHRSLMIRKSPFFEACLGTRGAFSRDQSFSPPHHSSSTEPQAAAFFSAVHSTIDLRSTFDSDLIARAILFAYYGEYPLTLRDRLSSGRRSSVLTRAASSISDLLCLPRQKYSASLTRAKQTLAQQCILHIEMQEVAHYLGMPSLRRYALLEIRKVLSRFEVRGNGDNVMEIVKECVVVTKDVSGPVRQAVGEALRDRSFLWSVPGNAWTLHGAVSRALRTMELELEARLEEELRLEKAKREAQTGANKRKMTGQIWSKLVKLIRFGVDEAHQAENALSGLHETPQQLQKVQRFGDMLVVKDLWR